MSDKERRMDFDRNHRSGGTTSNELFLCFTSRPSSNSTLMKIPSSKSIRSPNHHKNEKSREPTLSISSSRRIIRRNGSIKSGQFSPMMFPTTGSSKKRGCSFETPEPSSPKVTCIGQVRVKTKKQGKKILAKRRRNPKVSFRKSDHTQDEILQDNQQQNHQHSCLPYRNQKWVHFPFTICEALRSFGSDLNCFLPCGRSPCSPSMGKREKEEKWGKEANGTSTTTTTTSCAPILARWLMTLQDQDLEEEEEEKRDRMDMVFEVEEEEVERENLMVMEEEEDEKRVSICLPPKNALLLMRCRSDPSKLASLASRYCDSPEATKEDGDYSDEEHDEEDEDEEGMETELAEEQKLAEELTDKWSIDENQENHEFEENQEEEQLQQEEEEDARRNGGVEEKGLDQNEEIMANESLIEIGKNQTPQEGTILQEVEEDEDVNCDIEVLNPPKTEEEFMLEVQEEFEEVLGLNIVSEETPKILVLDEEPILKTLLDEDQELFENSRIKNPEPMLEEEEEVLVEVQEVEDMEHQELQEPKLDKVEEDHKIGEVTENQELEEEFMLLVVEEEKEEKEQEVVEKIEGMNDLSCIEKEPNLQEEETGVEENERISIAPSGKLDREDSELAIARAQEEKEEEELGLELEEGVEKLVMEEKERTQNKVGIIVIDKEKENINENEGCEEEGEESSKPEEKEIESKKVVLPDSMMWMMMCEPKLSMEVSKETWLCNGNFISSSWPYYDDNSRPPQLILNNKAAIDVQNQRRKHHHYQQQQQRQRRPLSSSCSLNPGRKVVLSMASMIEQKLVKTMAYEPLVLMRCKSEPIRSSIKLAPES